LVHAPGALKEIQRMIEVLDLQDRTCHQRALLVNVWLELSATYQMRLARQAREPSLALQHILKAFEHLEHSKQDRERLGNVKGVSTVCSLLSDLWVQQSAVQPHEAARCLRHAYCEARQGLACASHDWKHVHETRIRRILEQAPWLADP
jgi:hypothetical protein